MLCVREQLCEKSGKAARKKIPPPETEPMSSAWQADILATILQRTLSAGTASATIVWLRLCEISRMSLLIHSCGLGRGDGPWSDQTSCDQHLADMP